MHPVNPSHASAAPHGGSYADPVPTSAAADRPTAVVPIRSFHDSKRRLAGALDDGERAELLRASARGVVAALGDGPVLVVSDDHEVHTWAAALGIEVVAPGTAGLSRAAAAAREHLRRSGVRRMMVVHADIWSPGGLRSVADLAGIVIVPDLALDGTNVLVLPTDGEFEFAYGAGSFRRHLMAATRLASSTGASLCVRRDRSLGHDIDTPDDLHHPLTGYVRPETRSDT